MDNACKDMIVAAKLNTIGDLQVLKGQVYKNEHWYLVEQIEMQIFKLKCEIQALLSK